MEIKNQVYRSFFSHFRKKVLSIGDVSFKYNLFNLDNN